MSAFDAIRNDVSVITTNWFVNRCPLITRTPRVPAGSTTFSLPRTNQLQFCQWWQHPVVSSGQVSSDRTPFDAGRMEALQGLAEDMEYSSLYGRGEDPSVSGRPRQKGLRTLIKSNLVTAPVNAEGYEPTDLIRDTVERCQMGGGNPDVLLVSTNFMTAFAVWGQAVLRVDAGTNVFGTAIDIFGAPFLGGLSIIEAPLLKPSTAVCLTSSEIRMRIRRNEHMVDGVQSGEAFAAEGAIEIENEAHHSWVEGITRFGRTA